jgi:hypothetical protein
VRGAPTQSEGFFQVQTDIGNQTCRFDYTGSEAELKTKLDEFALTNSHIRDWTMKK